MVFDSACLVWVRAVVGLCLPDRDLPAVGGQVVSMSTIIRNGRIYWSWFWAAYSAQDGDSHCIRLIQSLKKKTVLGGPVDLLQSGWFANSPCRHHFIGQLALDKMSTTPLQHICKYHKAKVITIQISNHLGIPNPTLISDPLILPWGSHTHTNTCDHMQHSDLSCRATMNTNHFY